MIRSIKTVLFDLDGTLLDDPMTVFGPPFMRAVLAYFGRYVPADRAEAALLKGVEAMDANAGGPRTNEQVFLEVASVAMGIQADVLERHLGVFWADEFPKLAGFVRRLPEARPLVAWAFANGLQVVIATGMQTPLSVVECRLATEITCRVAIAFE